MKRFFKILMILFGIFLIFLFGFIIRISSSINKSLPDYTENVKLQGLTNEVTVYRDQYAVPHIYATNEADLYMVTGYIMAQDRLWQMDLLRRVTQGRLSEILPANMLGADLLFRSLKIQEKSKVMYDSASVEARNALKNFAIGVNRFIEDEKDNLPSEFKALGYQPEKWEAIHSLNLISYMSWSLKAGWTSLFIEELKAVVDEDKILELLPNTTLQKNTIFGEQSNEKERLLSIFDDFKNLEKYISEPLNASNNWAVSGIKSQSGKPILANDIHLDYSLPGTWFQIHQVIEGKLNVTGVALAGQPMVIAGHNEEIAWGLTNTYVDNLDLYEEKINPDNPNQYEFNGEWRNFTLDTFNIKNRKEKITTKTVRYNHRGPVITDFRNGLNKNISMKWIGNVYSNELMAIYTMNRATNWEEFTNALSGFSAISQNINYADRKGNIGLFCAAGIPVRERDINIGILPGWTDKYDWKGLVKHDELPFEYNPEKGYVAAANNKTIDDNYLHYIGAYFALPYRFESITELLEAKEKFSPGDFMQIQTNNKSKLAEKYMVKIKESIESNLNTLNKQQSILFEDLKQWDYTYEKNSNMALVFEQTYNCILENLLKDEMGETMFHDFLEGTSLPKYAMENAFNQRSFSWSNDVNTSESEENLSDIITRSFIQAVNIISKKEGRQHGTWEWGNWHKLELRHPLGQSNMMDRFFNVNRGPFGMAGSWHTIAQYGYSFARPYDMKIGSSQRHIYDLSNWDNSITVMPTGNSGIPASKHYVDQTELYINNKYHEDYFSKVKVTDNAKYVMTFEKVD